MVIVLHNLNEPQGFLALVFRSLLCEDVGMNSGRGLKLPGLALVRSLEFHLYTGGNAVHCQGQVI